MADQEEVSKDMFRRHFLNLPVTSIFVGSRSVRALLQSQRKAEMDTPVFITAKQLAETTGRVLDRENYSVALTKRTEAGRAEIHENDTDIFYAVTGSATLIIGGTVEGAAPIGPGEIRGTGIRNGQSYRFGKGDAVVIPSKTPHWISSVDGALDYLVIKIRDQH